MVTAALVEEVCQQFEQEGMTFTVVDLDPEARRLELRLEFDDVDCMDCVMPSEHMRRLIASSLERRTSFPFEVTLDDPRVQVPDVAEPTAATGNGEHSGRVVVLDPTAKGHGGDPDPGPDAGPLKGKTVLFRVDALWRSWDWTVDEWSRLLRESGAEVVTWKRWQGIPGEEGDRRQAEYEGLIGSADLVVSGLANCGSCSAWTIRDALTALGTGAPTVAVATEHFVPLAKILAEDGYRPGLRLLTLPYPLDTRPEDEVREIAAQRFGELLEIAGAEV